MNDKTGGTRGPRRAGALAIVAVVAVLAAACGGSGDPSPDITALGGPATHAQLVALARCMRGHGAPNFPDPTQNGLNLKDAGISPMSPQFQAAVRACQHELPAGMHISVNTHQP
jgi:hypothetical protein